MSAKYLCLLLIVSQVLAKKGGDGMGNGSTGVSCSKEISKYFDLPKVYLLDFFEKGFYKSDSTTPYFYQFEKDRTLDRRHYFKKLSQEDKVFIKTKLQNIILGERFSSYIQFISSNHHEILNKLNEALNDLVEEPFQFFNTPINSYESNDVGENSIFYETNLKRFCWQVQLFLVSNSTYNFENRDKSYYKYTLYWNTFRHLTEDEIIGLFLHEVLYLSVADKVEDAKIIRDLTWKAFNRDKSVISDFYQLFHSSSISNSRYIEF